MQLQPPQAMRTNTPLLARSPRHMEGMPITCSLLSCSQTSLCILHGSCPVIAWQSQCKTRARIIAAGAGFAQIPAACCQ